MSHSTMLHVRVDKEIKAQAIEALAAVGLSMSDWAHTPPYLL
ncbi:MAG: type II toxin-antitoxin system RelB/DinJ family antitoxin [Burkholderiaceae bacterium]|nr:type II toxin-antitoxin system RelB/DinJ family antitoxin [Burkholderiaceae bacterium]MDO9090283.1 type II toxin-antitoxin system RelB/DinJ family antitoxin [Burkholderiaceae bacterium]